MKLLFGHLYKFKHLREWILHGNWLNDSHEVIASFSIFSLLKYDTNGLGTKSPHSDPFDKTLLGLCIVSNVSNWSNFLLKNGIKFSVAGSCTISHYSLTI